MAGSTEDVSTTDAGTTTSDQAVETLTRQQCSGQATKSAAAGDLEAAIAWCSRALKLLREEDTASETDPPKRSPAAVVLLLRRAEYALLADRFEEALKDTDEVLLGVTTERKAMAKAVRIKCRALLATDRKQDALEEWQNRLGMGSRVLDELAFRREFNVKGATQEDDDPRYDLVLQYLYRRDFGNTISLLNKTLDAAKKGKGKSKSKDPVPYLLRARCRIELKDFEGAVADTERVITLLPTAVEAYRWLCEASIALSKHSHASRVCQLGLSLAPHDEALLELDARLKARKKERAEKREPRQKRLSLLPADKEVEQSGGMIAHQEEEIEEEEVPDPAFEAIRELKRAVKTDPCNAELYSRLSGLRFGLRQYEQAQNDATQAIALDSGAIDGYLRSCEALYAQRRYPKALRVCEQGLRMVEQTAGEVLEDLRVWEAKIQNALIHPPPEEPAEYTGPTGKCRVPKTVAARKEQRAQRKVDDAQSMRMKYYEKAVELADDRDFGNAVFWLNKAEGCEAAGKDFYAARIFALRARCRFELKQYEHVMKDAQQAIVYEPTDVESYRWLALSTRARGHMDKARAACSAGLSIDPEHKQLLSILNTFRVGPKASSK